MVKLAAERQKRLEETTSTGMGDMKTLIEQTKGQIQQSAKKVANIISADSNENFIKQRVKQMLVYDMSTAKNNLPPELRDLLKEAKKLAMGSSKSKYVNEVIE